MLLLILEGCLDKIYRPVFNPIFRQINGKEISADPVPGWILRYPMTSADLFDGVNSPFTVHGIAPPDLRSIRFNGIDQYLDKCNCNGKVKGTQANFSVSFWFKPVENATDGILRQVIAYGASGTGLDGFALLMPINSTKMRYISNGAGFNTIGNVVWNRWNFAVLTVSGNNRKLYLNNDTPTNNINSSNVFDSEILYIGTNTAATTNFWWGDLDDIRIYNRTLTVEEVDLLRDYYDETLFFNGQKLTFENETLTFYQRAW
jgi:hypothetical protein